MTRLEPDIPNEIPFESAHRTVPDVAVCVPAAGTTTFCVWTVCGAWEPTDAVTVEPSSPNETPFRSEKAKAERLPEVVPAETLTAEIRPAVEGTV